MIAAAIPRAAGRDTSAVFVGVDLTASSSRPSAYAVLTHDLSIPALGHYHQDQELISLLSWFSQPVVAIDAPLGIPAGLCCLEESCSCIPASPLKGRSCERDLAHSGIGCFFTTKRSIIKGMVYRAMSLSRQIEAGGGTPLEVYPYATKVRLFGGPIPAKNKRAGLTFLRERLRNLIPALEAFSGDLDHDLCDALLAAYTGYLHWKGQTEALGRPEEGVLVIPARGAMG